MATSSLLNRLKVLLPGKKSNDKGVTVTSTFNASNTENVLSAPTYRDHLSDIFDTRASSDSRALIQGLFRTDPDMSAAVNAFLTVADTEFWYIVRDVNGQVDKAGQQIVTQLVNSLTQRTDYTKGFKVVNSMNAIAESLRYMILMRGGIAAELVVSKELLPTELRQVDLGGIEWFEKLPGQFTPQQKSVNGDIISLDIPNFFATWFRRDPTGIYSYSPFISAINTIAARQQVINDLYRIMKITGFPRMEITVLEEVLTKNAPPDVKMDPVKLREYVGQGLQSVVAAVGALRADQTFVHTDSVVPKIMNDKPAAALNIDSVIDTLNGQNQAGLRTMATIIGRGESGVNTATVEARVFSLNAQAINKPISDMMAQALSLALRLNGSESYVQCGFNDVELRPLTELETNLAMRATRLKSDLSLGLITDEEYHLEMYNRLPPDSAPLLSGTGFMNAANGAAEPSSSQTDKANDPLTRAAQTKEKSGPARSNTAGANQIK